MYYEYTHKISSPSKEALNLICPQKRFIFRKWEILFKKCSDLIMSSLIWLVSAGIIYSAQLPWSMVI